MINQVTSMASRALILATCVLGCGGLVSGESLDKPPMIQNAPQEAAEVMHMHHNIIALRQAMLAEVEASHCSGRAGSTELSQAKIDLAHARLHLAEAQERHDEVKSELQTILAVHQDTLTALTLRRDSGRVTDHDLNEAHIAVLEAKIRLAQAAT